MNIDYFIDAFESRFPPAEHGSVSTAHADPSNRQSLDPCPDVPGMMSLKKQSLLNIAFNCLEENEAYLEIGTYLGKSLISAMLSSIDRQAYACDNFSQFAARNSRDILENNLQRYGLSEKIMFFDSDFRNIVTPDCIEAPVGLYFYDGAHDLESHILAIELAEPLLASSALVIVDDWRFADDSKSRAEEGTRMAIMRSGRKWSELYCLPARFNGDHAMWWNGVGVFASHA